MAGTAGSTGLGALAIGGIATVAVVIGGVVAMQFGVFEAQQPGVDQPESSGQVAVSVTDNVAVAQSVVVSEPANTNVQVSDAGQDDANAEIAETSDQSVEAVAPSVPVSVAAVEEGVSVAPDGQVSEQFETTPDAVDAITSADEAVVAVADAAVDAEPEMAVVAEETTQEQVSEPVAPALSEQGEQMVAVVASEQDHVTEAANAVEPNVEVEPEDTSAAVVPVAGGADPQVSRAASNAASKEEASPVEEPEQTVIAALAQPQSQPSAPEVAEEPSFVLAPPQLDLVRFDADGAGVIAGRAQAGVQVSVLLDGKVLEQVQVQNSGEFVSFPSIAPSTDARVVSLQAAFGDQLVMSDASFILAPSVAVTVEEPEAEQPPQQDVTPTDVTPVSPQPEPVEIKQTEHQDAVADAGDASQNSGSSSDESLSATDTVPVVVKDPVDVLAATNPDERHSAPATADTVKVVETESGAPQVADKPLQLAAPEPVAKPEAEVAPQPDTSSVAMAVLKSDAEGVELVQPATPVVPELVGKVALDTISYSDEGNVQLAGRASRAVLVRVYLDNSPVADILAAEDGRWKTQLSDIAPGIYTLRLDELDPAGKVLSRLETPFKRESPEVLQPPAAPEGSPAEPAPLVRAVTVQKGDTLWAISRERYGDGLLYVRVFEANKGAIRDPDLIYPGQIFSIPE